MPPPPTPPQAESTLAQLEALSERTRSLAADYAARGDARDGAELRQSGRFAGGLADDARGHGERCRPAPARSPTPSSRRWREAERRRAAVEDADRRAGLRGCSPARHLARVLNSTFREPRGEWLRHDRDECPASHSQALRRHRAASGDRRRRPDFRAIRAIAGAQSGRRAGETRGRPAPGAPAQAKPRADAGKPGGKAGGKALPELPPALAVAPEIEADPAEAGLATDTPAQANVATEPQLLAPACRPRCLPMVAMPRPPPRAGKFHDPGECARREPDCAAAAGDACRVAPAAADTGHRPEGARSGWSSPPAPAAPSAGASRRSSPIRSRRQQRRRPRARPQIGSTNQLNNQPNSQAADLAAHDGAIRATGPGRAGCGCVEALRSAPAGCALKPDPARPRCKPPIPQMLPASRRRSPRPASSPARCASCWRAPARSLRRRIAPLRRPIPDRCGPRDDPR